MKQLLLLIWLVFLSGAIFVIFWYYDWQYQLPTPIPDNYVAVKNGTYITLPDNIDPREEKPILLHFFNPDCPCSKFNLNHFKTLVRKYQQRVKFAIVVMSDENYTADNIKKRMDLDLPISFDTSLASKCGVYSTPQAVILNANRQIFYRGNYNKSRYCTDKNSNYVMIAIDNLLNNQAAYLESPFAIQPYGCQLPKCTLK